MTKQEYHAKAIALCQHPIRSNHDCLSRRVMDDFMRKVTQTYIGKDRRNKTIEVFYDRRVRSDK